MTIVTALLTRFNVKTSSLGNPKAVSPDWLRERLMFFASITIPAVLAQVHRPDVWLVFFDDATPQRSRDSIAALNESMPLMEPVFCDVLTPEVFRSALGRRLPSGATWLITTRLDSDDAVAPGLLSSVYETCRAGHREFVNPTQGLIVAGDRAYRKRDYSSPFISLSESTEDFRTVWLDQHHLLRQHGPIRQFTWP